MLCAPWPLAKLSNPQQGTRRDFARAAFAPSTPCALVSLWEGGVAGRHAPFSSASRSKVKGESGMPTSVLTRVLFRAVSTFARRKANFSACQQHLFSTHRTPDASAWGSKKSNRSVKLNFNLAIMADPKIEQILAPLRASVKEQVFFANRRSLLRGLFF